MKRQPLKVPLEAGTSEEAWIHCIHEHSTGLGSRERGGQVGTLAHS